jgi:D-beta-D-heptose 7-phosphate kinase/D-beta-D-heptose 1-phosphate adenosyltransferase
VLAPAPPRAHWFTESSRDLITPKLQTLEELLTLRASWSAAGKKVVWTNGCFDLLHVGHVRSFREAKALGDILIVGLNSDASVRAIKGDLRPVVCQEDRAETVAALESVDYVTIFEEPDPAAIISKLRPDIHCKGADYADGKRPIPEQAIIEAYGGEIRFLPLHEGRSTSGLIERICRAYK